MKTPMELASVAIESFRTVLKSREPTADDIGYLETLEELEWRFELMEADYPVFIRDQFAMRAMQGFAADPDNCMTPEQNARLAYKWADAMMDVREER